MSSSARKKIDEESPPESSSYEEDEEDGSEYTDATSEYTDETEEDTEDDHSQHINPTPPKQPTTVQRYSNTPKESSIHGDKSVGSLSRQSSAKDLAQRSPLQKQLSSGQLQKSSLKRSASIKSAASAKLKQVHNQRGNIHYDNSSSESYDSTSEDDADEDDTETHSEQDDEYESEMKAMFDLFDTNKDGHISSEELGIAMRSYGYDPSQFEIEDMINQIDANKNGQIEYNEFKKLMKKKLDYITRRDFESILGDFQELFLVFSEDCRDGNVTTERFKYILETLVATHNGTLSKLDIDKYCKIADQNGDGEIDYDEFVTILIRNNNELLNKISSMLKPFPLEYLRAFHLLPKSFRPSELHQVTCKGLHIPSNYLKAGLTDNGLAFQDIQLEAQDSVLKPCYAKTYRLSMVKAIGIPSLTDDSYLVLDKRIYIALHDSRDYQSNVYYLSVDDTRDDEWSFGQSTLNKIIIRTFCDDPNLFLFIELVMVVRRKQADSPIQHVCCGWTKIEFSSVSTNKENNIILPTVYELAVKGGTRTAPAQIDRKDIKIGRRGIAGRLALVMKGPPSPQLNIKMSSVLKPDEQRSYSSCPSNFIMSDDSCFLLSLYRRVIAREVLDKIHYDDRMKDQQNIALVWFPKLLDDLEIWRGFITSWNSLPIKLPKKKRDHLPVLAEEFSKLIAQYYPLLMSLSLPAEQYGEPANGYIQLTKFNYINQYRENMLEALNNDTYYKPFDAKQECSFSIY